jgi:hypothetical protein
MSLIQKAEEAKKYLKEISRINEEYFEIYARIRKQCGEDLITFNKIMFQVRKTF